MAKQSAKHNPNEFLIAIPEPKTEEGEEAEKGKKAGSGERKGRQREKVKKKKRGRVGREISCPD